MAIAKSSVSVITNRFVSEHGVDPRGYGYWYFIIKGSNGQKYVFDGVGMYSEAKKQAIKFAAEHDCCLVSLQS